MIIKTELMKPKKPFKFVNALVEMSEFFLQVKGFWDETTPLFNSTSALFRLSKKLKALKPVLKSLSREKVGDIIRKTREVYKNLCEAQSTMLTAPTQENIHDEAEAYRRWVFLSALEEKVISQRAKVHWLEVGDGNNKSFHRAAKIREI